MSEENELRVALARQPDNQGTWWYAPWSFGVRAVVGLLIFGVIAAAALLVDFVVRVLEVDHINVVIIEGLKLAEYALFLVDLGLFLVFIWRTARRTLQEL